MSRQSRGVITNVQAGSREWVLPGKAANFHTTPAADVAELLWGIEGGEGRGARNTVNSHKN